jgi:hypothetical protein
MRWCRSRSWWQEVLEVEKLTLMSTHVHLSPSLTHYMTLRTYTVYIE